MPPSIERQREFLWDFEHIAEGSLGFIGLTTIALSLFYKYNINVALRTLLLLCLWDLFSRYMKRKLWPDLYKK